MFLKTLTWNIGGAKLLKQSADPTLLASYSENGIDSIVDTLKSYSPDVIALQEVQKSDDIDQAAYIAHKLGYKHSIFDIVSDSHLDAKHRLGNAIISKYPLSAHISGMFSNPKLQVEWEDGSVAQSFDKGFSSCDVHIGNYSFHLTCLHLLPFRRFNVSLESEIAKSILLDVSNSLEARENCLIMGDFNINSNFIRPYMPRLFDVGLNEIDLKFPTNPKGHKYDHVLFRGMSLNDYKVDNDVLTDHFPVIASFIISD